MLFRNAENGSFEPKFRDAAQRMNVGYLWATKTS
jgi:hypothetical protein